MVKGNAVSVQIFGLPTRGLCLNSLMKHTQIHFDNMLSASAA